MQAIETDGSRYANRVTMGSHSLISDEPERLGGENLGPNPFELLGAALAVCTSMTIRMYAERKGWDVQNLEVTVDHSRSAVTRPLLEPFRSTVRTLKRNVSGSSMFLTDVQSTR